METRELTQEECLNRIKRDLHEIKALTKKAGVEGADIEEISRIFYRKKIELELLAAELDSPDPVIRSEIHSLKSKLAGLNLQVTNSESIAHMVGLIDRLNHGRSAKAKPDPVEVVETRELVQSALAEVED